MIEERLRGGFPLAYADHGAGQPVVLLPAFPTDHRLYAGLVRHVSHARLLLPDLPGFGETRLGPDAPPVLDVERLADVVADWLGDLELGPAVVGGTAIGGYVALELAVRRPDLVAGLVLIGCRAAPDAPERAPDREAVARRALDAGSAAVADDLAALPLAPGADGRAVAIVHRMITEADPRAIAALVRGIATRPDPVPALRRIAVPALVIGGTADPFCPIAAVRELAKVLTDATLVEIDGAGHFPSLEQPVLVGQALDSFVGALR
jgi:pimeloyl-ACP methyl ester carboxylesterase